VENFTKDKQNIGIIKLNQVYGILIKPFLTTDNLNSNTSNVLSAQACITATNSWFNDKDLVEIKSSEYKVTTAISQAIGDNIEIHHSSMYPEYSFQISVETFDQYCRKNGLGENVYALIAQIPENEQYEVQGFSRY